MPHKAGLALRCFCNLKRGNKKLSITTRINLVKKFDELKHYGHYVILESDKGEEIQNQYI